MTAGSQATPGRRLRATAPAKINLGLRVVGRRRDGYHLLESLFVPLDLADDVEITLEQADEPRAELLLSGAAGGVPDGGENLAVRAAQSFLRESGLRVWVGIRLTKRIPVAAGLGGGSSDAAAVLRELATHYPGSLSLEALRSLALDLGADVPFFLDPRPALVAGIGERITPVSGVPPLALILAHPGVQLPTARVFRAFDALGCASSEPGAVPPATVLEELLAGERSSQLLELAHNDLEAAAVRLCPPIARLRERLEEVGCPLVGMSGSGPTLYAAFASSGEASAALQRAALEPPAWARVVAAIHSC